MLLTLEEAVEIARRRSPLLEGARSAAGSAAVFERSRWGAFLPDLAARVSLGGGTSEVVSGVDDAGRPYRLDTPDRYTTSSTTQGLSASITLFDGFRRLNELQAARAATAAAAATVDVTVTRVRAEVTRRFYAALGAVGRIQLEERLLASAEQRLEAMRAMFPAGRATREDVLGARIDVVRQQLSLKRARGEARKRKLLLREIMGMREDFALRLVGEFPEPFDPALLDGAELVESARRSSPRLERARARAEEAEQRADAARGLRWPTIRIGADLSRSFGLPSYDALTILSPDNQSFGFGLTASLPIFTGFTRSARIAQAEASSTSARAGLRAERLAVEREVRTALIDLSSAYASVRLADRVAELSRERLEVAQTRFRLGDVPFFALQQFIGAAAGAERAAVAARIGYAQALVSLEQVVGRSITPPAAGQPNERAGAEHQDKGN